MRVRNCNQNPKMQKKKKKWNICNSRGMKKKIIKRKIKKVVEKPRVLAIRSNLNFEPKKTEAPIEMF